MPKFNPANGNKVDEYASLEHLLGTRAITLQPEKTSYDGPEPRAGCWLELLASGVPHEVVGKRVSKYVETDPQARALVFFGFDQETLQGLLRQVAQVTSIEVIFAKNLSLTPVGAVNLMELCYGHKPWITKPIKQRMARERLVLSSNALVVLITGWELAYERVQDLKSQLRGSLPNLTFERRVHGTDDVDDTRTLVEAITSTGTLALLNRVEVAREDRVFARIPVELRHKSGICVDGSSVMELYGLRKSRDLDFICSSDSDRSLVESLGFDVNNERYDRLPLGAKQVIEDPFLHLTLFGYKFSALSVRNMILSFGDYAASASWGAKKERDFVSISLYNAGSPKMRIGIAGVIGTLVTQLRLGFEFVVTKVAPLLPPGLLAILRTLRRVLVRKY